MRRRFIEVVDDGNCIGSAHAWLRIEFISESGKHSIIEIPARRVWVVGKAKFPHCN